MAVGKVLDMNQIAAGWVLDERLDLQEEHSDSHTKMRAIVA